MGAHPLPRPSSKKQLARFGASPAASEGATLSHEEHLTTGVVRQPIRAQQGSMPSRLHPVTPPPGPELTSGQDGSVNNQTQPLPGIPDNPPATIATQPPPGTWPPLMSDLRAGQAPVRVLICGHSYVFWAGRRASSTAVGTQLGLSRIAHVQWMGKRGMRWEHLPSMLFQPRVAFPPPQVLLIHLGGNDMGVLTGKALILQAIADFQLIRQRWPGILILWSCIIPRQNWRAGRNPRALDRASQKVNSEIYKHLLKHGDVSIQHPSIIKSRRELYRSDGVHLSDLGNDLFLLDLQRGLQEIILHRWGDSTKP
ncbi:uncharacterized protein LOC134401275 [Elgaria multicarinata webbii]|uniref:uncharacterized protein LOC134401275 n=1 Tax=Elgaria multicarinata webbii TaxID=159646 RepID=UPI002FCD28F0